MNPQEKVLLLKQIASYLKPEEISKWATERFGRPVPVSTVKYHTINQHNAPILKKFRDEYEMNLQCVEWASKRRRLEELGKIYEESRDEGKNAIALASLREMREEIEGKKMGGITLTQNNYMNMTDEEIDKKRLELLELVQKHRIIKQKFTPEDLEDCKEFENQTIEADVTEVMENE